MPNETKSRIESFLNGLIEESGSDSDHAEKICRFIGTPLGLIVGFSSAGVGGALVGAAVGYFFSWFVVHMFIRLLMFGVFWGVVVGTIFAILFVIYSLWGVGL